MKLKGPYTYQVSVGGEDSYSVLGETGKRTFLAPVTTRGPKLYVFSHGSSLIYIGQTVQGMSARMRLGFKADGTGGYWGYRWSKELAEASLHIWVLDGCDEEEEFYALECIESEVVYLYRSEFNQWPKRSGPQGLDSNRMTLAPSFINLERIHEKEETIAQARV